MDRFICNFSVRKVFKLKTIVCVFFFFFFVCVCVVFFFCVFFSLVYILAVIFKFLPLAKREKIYKILEFFYLPLKYSGIGF